MSPTPCWTVSAVDFGTEFEMTRVTVRACALEIKDGRKTDTVAIAMDPTRYSLFLASQ